jgi:carbon-monoxide dehydrogenase large subunit
MSILGNRVRRMEDPRLLRGEGRFLDDLDDPLLEGALHVVFVRSYMAHGTIEGIEVSEALDQPGVRGAFTAATVDLQPTRAGGAGAHPSMARPWLATDRVRFVGEPVAVVVADTLEQAVDAAESVVVEIEPLPAVIGIEAGFADEVLLFPEAGTNRNSLMDGGWADAGGAPGWAAEDDDGEFWDGCEVVVRATVVNQRLAGVPLEGRGSAAVWQGGRLIQWISSQNVHGARGTIARAHALEASEVRVIAPDVGGGFGPKINPGPEDVVVGWLARHLGRPVTWTETRSENLVAQPQGRGHLHRIAIGGRRDGTVLAYELDVRADSGAYPSMGSFLPHFTRLMASGVYDIPRVRTRAESAVTNTTPIEAYRGAGRPEAAATIERAIDLFAAEVGFDPVEVRRRNLIAAFTAPHETAAGAVYDCGDYAAALDAALAAADYEGLRREQARRREQGDRRALGIGVSMYVEITGAGMTTEYGGVSVRRGADGDVEVEVLTGSSPHGQGLHTALAMITSDRLGVPMERITVRHGDTDLVPSGLGTMGSRSLQMGGSAVSSAAEGVARAAAELAASELEAAVEDVVVDAERGVFHVAGTPAVVVEWERVVELAEQASPAGPDGRSPLSVGGEFSTDGLTYPDGCHVAVVEVDLDTGMVELVRLVACDDAGRILNPMLAEGQRHGGIAQGVAQVLFEAVRYDDSGNPLTATLADYGIPSAVDVPPWELVALETPTPMNPLGAKGIGESGTIGATPAVQSAVIDALAPFGVRHLDLPLTPERVWRAVTGSDDRLDTSSRGGRS